MLSTIQENRNLHYAKSNGEKFVEKSLMVRHLSADYVNFSITKHFRSFNSEQFLSFAF